MYPPQGAELASLNTIYPPTREARRGAFLAHQIRLEAFFIQMGLVCVDVSQGDRVGVVWGCAPPRVLKPSPTQ
eukprot:5115717-Pyramimonas_sp.AAC.2